VYDHVPKASGTMSVTEEAGGNAASGPWITGVRLLWLLVAIFVLVLLVPELQATFEAAKHLCAPATCSDPQIPRQSARALRGIGISLEGYATLRTVLDVVGIAVCYLVAVALMLRRSNDRMVHVTAFACVLFCTSAGLTVREAGGVWATPSHLGSILGAIIGPLLLYMFPTGTFVPRWSAALAVLFMIMGLIPAGLLPGGVSLVLFLAILVSILALQVYRYRTVSTALQRQQTKLVVFGICLYCGTTVLLGVLLYIFPDIQGQAVPLLAVGTVAVLSPLFVIVSIGLAVMCHGLWDVDVLINRTLIYVTLTASLVLVYLGSVLAFQTVFGAVIGKQSGVAVALSTLIIAALFNPLRRRIQDVIARTFYRQRYDASRVLGAFISACSDETDLDALSTNVLLAVNETMRPATASLWLRPER
jgi:hypothetical protein